jgi:TetR/AcrR family fatty acid metabolism transcriptional regulator
LNYKTKLVFEGFREEVDKAGDAIDKLRNLVRRHLEEFQANRNMAVVYQAVIHQNNRLVRDRMKDISKMYLDLVAEIVEKGQEEGTMRKDLYLGLVKRFILGSVDSTITNWLLAGGRYDMASMADPLVDLFIRGIGSDDAREITAGTPAGVNLYLDKEK